MIFSLKQEEKEICRLGCKAQQDLALQEDFVVYVIDDFQLIQTHSQLYLSNYGKGVKIANANLAALLTALKNQPRLEITQADLMQLAEQHHIDFDALKKLLITQLNILKPLQARKFAAIYLNSDDALVSELLHTTLSKQYHSHVIDEHCYDFKPESLVIFYRKNYSNPTFKTLYQQLANDTYVITAGVMHKLLVIDNLYLKESGLPSHFSNLHQLMAYLHSDIPTTKNNWLLFYRELLKQGSDQFPDPQLNACQQGYIAYCLYQFACQFTNLWGAPTTLDKINWFWHVDLTNFTIQQEIAVHSPFAEQDMKINLTCQQTEEVI